MTKVKNKREIILKVNPGINPNSLFVGQMINIPDESRAKRCISKAELDLKSNMRLLWEQHIAWTRMTIFSLIFNLPDVDFVITRHLQNATDMGNSLRRYNGDRIANKYSSLIRVHLLIASDLVKAAHAGNTKAAEDIEKKWYTNADEIAQFPRGINRYLPKDAVRKMFYEHLALTKTEAVLMISKDYKTGVAVFDKIEAQALEMADNK